MARRVTEIEVWRAAAQMVRMFGDDAEIMACQRADGAIDQGDAFNEKLWTRVAAAVKELQRQKPNACEPLN